MSSDFSVVTGAFSYTGKYITQKLLAAGGKVRTLTRDLHRPNPFSDQVSVAPFNFESPRALIESLRGATTLYNTYWVRFSYSGVTFDQAIKNTRTLFTAAKDAGVHRVVHVSVTNATEQSPLPYFKGKGVLERVLRESSLSYAIIRPTLVFGVEDVLLNNITWLLRHFPVFMIPGSGDYQLQPVFVDDVADIAVRAAQVEGDLLVEAAGPELYTFSDLITLIANKAGSKVNLIHSAPGLVTFFLKVIGRLVHDVVLTPDELTGLMANLLVPSGPPTGPTRLSDWLDEHIKLLGGAYTSELARNYRGR